LARRPKTLAVVTECMDLAIDPAWVIVGRRATGRSTSDQCCFTDRNRKNAGEPPSLCNTETGPIYEVVAVTTIVMRPTLCLLLISSCPSASL
jgi:hypothetical protein